MNIIHRISTIPSHKIPKKRKTNAIQWRRDLDKFRRCQPKGPPLPPSCNHSHSKFECSLLAQRDMESFHRKFYYTRKKAKQDAFILRHCQGRSPKRKSSVVQKERKLVVEYYVPSRERNVQVCKEAFIGILRVNKSRINALLKSFYKIDVSKDCTREEHSSPILKRRCRGRRRKMGKGKSEIEKNSKSLENIETATQREFSVKERCHSECAANDDITSCSIASIENKVQEEKPLKYGRERNSDILCDWLDLHSKPRRHRTFDWSPLKRTPTSSLSTIVDSKNAVDSSQLKKFSVSLYPYAFHSNSNIINQKNICTEVADETTQKIIPNQIIDSSQKRNVSALSCHIPCHSKNNISNENNIFNEFSDESTQQRITHPRISLHDNSNVYESKRRKLRKLQFIDGKENIHQNEIKKKKNVHNSKSESKAKSVVAKKKLEKTFVKTKSNKFVQKNRFPLRTLC